MDKIQFKNFPDLTTPLSATNLNQMQTNIETDINTRAKIVHQREVNGQTTNTFRLADVGIYLVIVHSNANNACGFDIVNSNGTTLNKTSIYANQYISITYTDTIATIVPTYAARIKIVKF